MTLYCQDRKIGKFKRNRICSFQIRVYINRMLVSLDVHDDIVKTTSALYETGVAFDRESSVASPGTRGRPLFELTKEQLSFLLDQGFKVKISQRHLC